MRTPKPRRGFTLLEVMISIMILVLAIAAIAPLFALASTSHQRGIDQAEVAWLAPRIAARIQERFYDNNPKEIKGFVRVYSDGSFVLDNMIDKLPDDRGSTYAFKASLKSITSTDARQDPIPYTCFILRVEVSYREEGNPLTEGYETVVLRKFLR